MILILYFLYLTFHHLSSGSLFIASCSAHTPCDHLYFLVNYKWFQQFITRWFSESIQDLYFLYYFIRNHAAYTVSCFSFVIIVI